MDNWDIIRTVAENNCVMYYKTLNDGINSSSIRHVLIMRRKTLPVQMWTGKANAC
ncbi:MAG: hypothetical protein FWD21_02445 [Peptococcaceae bacterium]|nr:hypothetical protein [Peptococcaceae bacterium]